MYIPAILIPRVGARLDDEPYVHLLRIQEKIPLTKLHYEPSLCGLQPDSHIHVGFQGIYEPRRNLEITCWQCYHKFEKMKNEEMRRRLNMRLDRIKEVCEEARLNRKRISAIYTAYKELNDDILELDKEARTLQITSWDGKE